MTGAKNSLRRRQGEQDEVVCQETKGEKVDLYVLFWELGKVKL